MDFFDDDPFESIVREFFGRGETETSGNRFIRGEDEERTIDFIKTRDKIFLIFEIPGYSKEDIEVNVKKGEIEIRAKRKDLGKIQGYLSQKLGKGVYFRRTLPKYANEKKLNFTFRNGILEVAFERK